MSYKSVSDINKSQVRNVTKHGKEIYKAAFNAAYPKYGEKVAHMIANSAVTKSGQLKNEDARNLKRLAAHAAVGAALGGAESFFSHPGKENRKKRIKAALAGAALGGADSALHDYIDKHYENFEGIAGSLAKRVAVAEQRIPLGRGSFQRAVESRLSGKILESVTVNMEVGVSDDGYLIAADYPRLKWGWDQGWDEDEHGELQIIQLHNVPEELADKLYAQGTSDQEFSDGYEAWEAARKYAVSNPLPNDLPIHHRP
jgi:cation transport regulator ChaB